MSANSNFLQKIVKRNYARKLFSREHEKSSENLKKSWIKIRFFLLEKSVHSNYVDRVSDPNLKMFSNLIHI